MGHYLLSKNEIPCLYPKRAAELLAGTHEEDLTSLGRWLVGGIRRRRCGSPAHIEQLANYSLEAAVESIKKKEPLVTTLWLIATLNGIKLEHRETAKDTFGLVGKKLSTALTGLALWIGYDPDYWHQALNGLTKQTQGWTHEPHIFYKKTHLLESLNAKTDEDFLIWTTTEVYQITDRIQTCEGCGYAKIKHRYKIEGPPKKDADTPQTRWVCAACACQVKKHKPQSLITQGLLESFDIRKYSYFPFEESMLLEANNPKEEKKIWVEYLGLKAAERKKQWTERKVLWQQADKADNIQKNPNS